MRRRLRIAAALALGAALGVAYLLAIFASEGKTKAAVWVIGVISGAIYGRLLKMEMGR